MQRSVEARLSSYDKRSMQALKRPTVIYLPVRWLSSPILQVDRFAQCFYKRPGFSRVVPPEKQVCCAPSVKARRNFADPRIPVLAETLMSSCRDCEDEVLVYFRLSGEGEFDTSLQHFPVHCRLCERKPNQVWLLCPPC